jgi:hypothetical protein
VYGGVVNKPVNTANKTVDGRQGRRSENLLPDAIGPTLRSRICHAGEGRAGAPAGSEKTGDSLQTNVDDLLPAKRAISLIAIANNV